MATEVIMPEMGEGVVEGTVSRWLKQEGDSVDQYEPILEIETDKVTTEATAEEAGTLLKIVVPEGKTVAVGTVLAYIGAADETAPVPLESRTREGARTAVQDGAPAPPAASDASAAPSPAPSPARPAPTNGAGGAYRGRISPVVGRIAAEHNVDLSQVAGTGRDGRITKKDILAHVAARGGAPAPGTRGAGEAPATAAPVAPPSAPTPAAVPDDIAPLTSIRRAIAEHMVRSKATSPHVTTLFEVSFHQVAAHREAHKEQFQRDGANLTYTTYIAAATIAALKAHPLVNSSWTDEGIRLHPAINLGLAAAIDGGLIVPVIKNADGLNLLGLARAINDITERARNNALQPADVRDGTFTITNHGVSGSLLATPIINQPQCGILGVGKIEKRVTVIDDAIAIRRMAYVTLTFDHRILDGAAADAFVSHIKTTLENWA